MTAGRWAALFPSPSFSDGEPLVGSRAVRRSSTLDKAVIDPRLKRRLPQLFDPERAFADCLRR